MGGACKDLPSCHPSPVGGHQWAGSCSDLWCGCNRGFGLCTNSRWPGWHQAAPQSVSWGPCLEEWPPAFDAGRARCGSHQTLPDPPDLHRQAGCGRISTTTKQSQPLLLQMPVPACSRLGPNFDMLGGPHTTLCSKFSATFSPAPCTCLLLTTAPSAAGIKHSSISLVSNNATWRTSIAIFKCSSLLDVPSLQSLSLRPMNVRLVNVIHCWT